MTRPPHIGTLNEGSLHVAIKDLLAEPGDQFEVGLDGFVIDIVRGEQLIEVQTSGFAAMSRKLDHLLDTHRLHLVHPIATRTWLVRDGHRDRRSPKRGSVYSVFEELTSVPTLLDHPGFSLEVILIEQDRIQVPDPAARRGRGGWRTVDRRLRTVVDRRVFASTTDIGALLPPSITAEFTTADIAAETGIARRQAQAMAYCLRHSGMIIEIDRRRDGVHYRRAG